MQKSARWYTLLLAAVGLGRLIELSISRRHQRRLASRGAARVREQHFYWMVLLHSGVLLSAALEVWGLRRRLLPRLAAPMALLFALSNLLRWWVIRTLAEHWNVQVMNSVALGVVTRGPYRWVRHPNYAAVFVELLALPLIHSAWLTSLLGSLAHLLVLRQRIRVEESILHANPEYVALMGSKPRFIPRQFGLAKKLAGLCTSKLETRNSKLEI